MRSMQPRLKLALACCLFAAPSLAAGDTSPGVKGEPGVKDTEVVFGECAALTGSASGLGVGMNQGLQAAFDDVNARGGVHGRRLRLIASDDGYDPEKCVDCTEKMIEESAVFALTGFVGTPTAKVAVPIAGEMQVPIVGLFTGAPLLREPVQRYVINIRASYDDEMEALVEHLTQAGARRIAVFYQNDSFGLSGLGGAEKALQRRSMAVAGKGSFERNTVAVQAGLSAIIESSPDAIIIVAPYKPTAEFVRAGRLAGLTAQFATISFVGTENLIATLGQEAAGILISQVVPSPSDAALPLARDYRAALRKSVPDAAPSYPGFEGYITGRVLAAALDQAGRELTREKLIEAFHAMPHLDLGGLTLSFSPANHQGSNAVFLTVVKGGSAQPVR